MDYKKVCSILLICWVGSFIYGCEKPKRTRVDILTTLKVTPTTIVAGGYIIEWGKNKLISQGICYNLVPNSQVEGNFVVSTESIGSRLFNCNLTGLISDTTYYLRAYVADETGKFFYSEEITVQTVYSIGSPGPAGGIVFYVDGMGGGLELAPMDQGAEIVWGCQGTSIVGAQNTGLGYGDANTNAILTDCADPICAAKICDDFILNGYSDWYLPSLDELSLVYLNIFNEHKGNLSPGFYWSSTEQNSERAWQYLFGTGSKVDNYKSYDDSNVRAVRSF